MFEAYAPGGGAPAAYVNGMDNNELDKQLIAAAFQQAGLVGWREVNLVDAAREAGLDLAAVRGRFPGKTAVLLRFGSLADQAVLAAAPLAGLPREKLFDVVMARFDQLQQHRAGVLAVMESVRFDPGLAVLLWGATLRSMKWMLEAAGVPATGVVGALRVHGLAAVWAYALRAWETDESSDLASVMAAVDRGLDRAVQAEGMLPGYRSSVSMESPPPIMSGDAVVGTDEGPALL